MDLFRFAGQFTIRCRFRQIARSMQPQTARGSMTDRLLAIVAGHLTVRLITKSAQPNSTDPGLQVPGA